MAIFYGVAGGINAGSAFTGVVINVTGWQINTSREVFDSTVLASTTDTITRWKTFLGGHVEWSGSFEGYVDDATTVDTAVLGLTATAATFIDGDRSTYKGLILISGLEIENDHQDIARLRGTFQGSNTLTILTGA